jgi:transposase
MNKFKFFVGIDISKKTFDAALLKAGNSGIIIHRCFEQSQAGYALFVKWLTDNGATLDQQVLICLEHTGIYINGLVSFLVSTAAGIWVEMPLRIKKSMGLQRGSDDKIAAINIAQYAYRFQDQARLWKPVDTTLQQLRNLLAQRDRLLLTISQLSVPLNEMEACGNQADAKQLKKLQQKATTGLQKSLEAVEQAIDDKICADQQINKVIGQVTSIKGVGKQTAIKLYVYTRGFSAFENGKQLACYCGVVPFGKSSGTNVRYKPGVSPFANKNLKKLLHLCAMSALRWDAEIRAYYLRKVGEGKNKMSVINAIRNKILQRIFAVVRDGRYYVENYSYAGE